MEAYLQFALSISCEILFLKNNCFYLFCIFDCAGSLLLGGVFSSCGQAGGYSVVAVQGLLSVVLLLLRSMGSRACGLQCGSCSSQALEHSLSSCGS